MLSHASLERLVPQEHPLRLIRPLANAALDRLSANPDTCLEKKAAGRAAKPCHMGHGVMENRNGLAVAAEATRAAGTASARRPGRWSENRLPAPLSRQPARPLLHAPHE
jgi:hypothetical protein